MAIVINGSGTVTGISVGGLPDGIFDDDRDGTTTWVDTINEIKGRHPK
jgi:hypothetical protein